MTKWLAERLRRIADRIDYAGSPKAMGWSFTFEQGEGIRFREDGRGCRLWYLGDRDYERAHTEAGIPNLYARAVGRGRPGEVVRASSFIDLNQIG